MEEESTADATSLLAAFYLPPYVVINSIKNWTTPSIPEFTVNGSTIFFKVGI